MRMGKEPQKLKQSFICKTLKFYNAYVLVTTIGFPLKEERLLTAELLVLEGISTYTIRAIYLNPFCILFIRVTNTSALICV